MQIQVTRDFAGRLTQERRIYPGEYSMDDPALFGVGQYLLDNGFAILAVGSVQVESASTAAPRVVDTIEHDGRKIERLLPDEWDMSVEVTEEADEIPDGSEVVLFANEDRGEPQTVGEPVDYNALSINELKALLNSRDIEYRDNERKAYYVELAQDSGV